MSNYNNGKGFMCTDYLLLKPEEASLLDLLKLLWSSNDHHSHFIETPLDLVEELTRFRYRWIVFMSACMMKLFLLIKTPLSYIEYVLLIWLNLVSDYDGVLKLLLNLIKGKVKMPKWSSKTFRSIMGCLDMRVDLDLSITQGHPKYEAMLSIMASKLSYENSAFISNVVENHWKMELIGAYNFRNDYLGKNSTQAFISQSRREDKDLTVVAFKGTSPLDVEDWCTDISISWYGLTGVGRVHGGFMKALGLQIDSNFVANEIDDLAHGNSQYAYYTIKKILKEICEKNKNARFLLTGHSLGGALAILFASVIILHEEKELLERLEGVYTFGQPRVGDDKFGEFMIKKLKAYNVHYYRYVYCNDMVPRLPYDDKTLLFKHFGPCLYFNSCYKGKVLQEEPNKNYISLLWVIPKYLNAVWELNRGLIFPYWKWGSSYREGWCERTFRVIGLVIPGLSAHGPQDYDNITRLGHLSLPHHPSNDLTYIYDRN